MTYKKILMSDLAAFFKGLKPFIIKHKEEMKACFCCSIIIPIIILLIVLVLAIVAAIIYVLFWMGCAILNSGSPDTLVNTCLYPDFGNFVFSTFCAIAIIIGAIIPSTISCICISYIFLGIIEGIKIVYNSIAGTAAEIVVLGHAVDGIVSVNDDPNVNDTIEVQDVSIV
jgi:hypothetical protein